MFIMCRWLQPELTNANAVNDTSFHRSIVLWFADRFKHGIFGLDGWTPTFSLGYPVSHHYQTLPHRIAGFLEAVTGSDRMVSLLTVVLLALWPLAMCIGLRMMRLDRVACVVAAMLIPLVSSYSGEAGSGAKVTGYGYELESYVWRGQGVWAQMFAMVLMPIVVAMCWRFVQNADFRVMAPVMLSLVVAFHFITAYLAFIAVGVMILTNLHRKKYWFRGGMLGALGAVLAAWVVVPLALDDAVTARSVFIKDQYWTNSFGFKQVCYQLFTGKLFDADTGSNLRWLPVLSLMVALGATTCVIRFHQPIYRFLLTMFVVSVVLFSGTETFEFLGYLPGGSGLLFHRFILAVHFFGIALMGVGVAGVVSVAMFLFPHAQRVESPALPRMVVTAVVTSVLALSIPISGAYAERDDYMRLEKQWIEGEAVADLIAEPAIQAMLERISEGTGRAVAGYFVGSESIRIDEATIAQATMAMVIAQRGVDQVGFALRTTSMMSDVEPRFGFNNPASYDLFGVKYLIMKADLARSGSRVPATLVGFYGKFALFEVPGDGYVGIYDLVGPALRYDRADVNASGDAYLATSGPADGFIQPLDFSEANVPQNLATADPPGRPGTVQTQDHDPDSGRFKIEANMDRSGVAVLRSSYHTRFVATVDGVPADVFPVAPAYNAVQVPAGHHVVEFKYQPTRLPEFLLAMDAIFIAALLVFRKRWPRWLRVTEEDVSTGRGELVDEQRSGQQADSELVLPQSAHGVG